MRGLKYGAGTGDKAKLKLKLDLVFHMRTSDHSYFGLVSLMSEQRIWEPRFSS